MQFHEKNFLIYLISRVFLPGLFFYFLACCVGIYARIEDQEVWTFITRTTGLYEQMEEVPTIENV